MNEKNYLIQFDYDGECHSIHNLSHNEFKQGTLGDILWIAQMVEMYLDDNNLRGRGQAVTNIRLICDGDVQFSVKSFNELEANGAN